MSKTQLFVHDDFVLAAAGLNISRPRLFTDTSGADVPEHERPPFVVRVPQRYVPPEPSAFQRGVDDWPQTATSKDTNPKGTLAEALREHAAQRAVDLAGRDEAVMSYVTGKGGLGAVTGEQLREATAVGDLNSDARGTGARKNSGKTPYSLVPISTMAESFMRHLEPDEYNAAAEALAYLGDFQSSHDVDHLYSLIDVLGIGAWADCALVFQYGMKKYKAWNWAKGMPWTVPLECAVRHLLDMIEDGMDAIDLDKPGAPGSQLPHRGHVMCNVCMLLAYSNTWTEGNDLPPVGLLG